MLIVFDLDGTLIDGYAGITDALGFAMTRLGRTPLAPERVRVMVGRGLESLLEEAVGRELAPRGVLLFRERYALVADAMTTLMPDVPEVLRNLAAAGHTLVVASNKPADFSRRILEAKGVAGFLAAIGGPDAATPPKPHPAMLERLIAGAGARSDRTVVVGDMEIDAEFAQAAGCRCVLVPGGSRSAEYLADVPADGHLSRLAELPGWIESTSMRAGGRLETS